MLTDTKIRASEHNLETILDWLALAQNQANLQDRASEFRDHLLILRESLLPPAQRGKLLDLFFGLTGRLYSQQLTALHDISLPISRKARVVVKGTQEILEALARDYANLANPPFDGSDSPVATGPLLCRALQLLNWHLQISHLVASPAGMGIWQFLHQLYARARKSKVTLSQLPGSPLRLQQIYISGLLLAITQPASFTSRELDFIATYAAMSTHLVRLEDETPKDNRGVYWIDPEKDIPAHALARRAPGPETNPWYFTCGALADNAADHLAALEGGMTASKLDLPAFADSPAGQGVLRRLNAIWGHPAKRKFPRRRQSYRAELCAGLEQLWTLMHDPDSPPETSEWMITNESPDGFAMMHMSGNTKTVRVGDIVGLRAMKENSRVAPPWYVCIVRWALSENPEHIELGLQILASKAIPAVIAQPHIPGEQERTSALLLPEVPPLRPQPSLVVPTGALGNRQRKLVVMVEQENLEIRELRATGLDEQTSCIEVFSVASDGTQ